MRTPQTRYPPLELKPNGARLVPLAVTAVCECPAPALSRKGLMGQLFLVDMWNRLVMYSNNRSNPRWEGFTPLVGGGASNSHERQT